MSETHQTDRQEDSAVRHTAYGAGAKAHVRVVYGRAAGEVHEVRPTGTTFGRTTSACVTDVVVDDTRMSRVHVRIELGRLGWQLADLGSRNGGFVDGRGFPPAAEVPLNDGSVIRLGDTLLVFRARAAPADAPAGDTASFPGVSPAAEAVRRRIATLAAATGHALVFGETGTGKERVSRAIALGRTPGQLVTVNCPELKSHLARSELFGHVKGAFTGAVTDRPGLVDVAGALFLDEFGDLPLDVQGELLRFLEDGSYRPIGARDLKRSSARVIAATNVDLDRAVANGTFRRDLAARIRNHNAPLELPPLRERREDIALWSMEFLAEAGLTLTREAAWTAGALESLMLYPWLENLRELRRVVRTVVENQSAFPCSTDHLPPIIPAHRSSLRGAANPAAEESTPPREVGRNAIEDALRQTVGNMRAAAALLGIDRRKLYRLCERFGIAIDQHRPGDDES